MTTAKSVHELCAEEASLGDLPQYFADHPKELHAVNEKGETPLFSAARSGSLAIVNYLLKCGADLNAKNIDGQLVLHTAAQFGHLPLVHFFILKGMGVNERDTKENSTPLHWAVVNNKADVVRYLLNCGADPLLLTKKGVNAIHLAAGLGFGSVLLAILDKCKDGDWKREDATGRTPAMVAKQNNKKDIFSYLRNYKPIRSNYDWLGWAIMPPYLIIAMGLAPSYPWFALAAALVLGLYCVLPWRGYLFNADKAYYIFLGLVGFSLVVNIKQAGDYLGPSIEFGLYALLTLAASVFYALAIFTNPGIHVSPKAKDDKEFLKGVDQGETNVKVCHTCMVRRPARAKHCHQVDGCVLRFDHFCVWVGNAVGAGNHIYFMLFLFFIIPMEFFCAIIHVKALLLYTAGMTWTEMLIASVCQYPTVLFIAIFAVLGLWQIPLLLQQLHSICVGLTAYEKMDIRKKYVEQMRHCKSGENNACANEACANIEWTNGLGVRQNIKEFIFGNRAIVKYSDK